jgi:hypothetical protein
MALGNWGVTRNLIQGLVASEPAEENRIGGVTGVFPDSQGLAIFADQMTQVATRADLDSSKNVKVAMRIFDGTNDVDISTTPALLLGVCAWTNASQSEDQAVTFYNTTTPTEGTTRFLAAVFVGAGGTAATAKTASVVYNEPVVFDTALSFSSIDNGSDTDIEGTTLGDANGTKVLIVYAN